MSLCESLPSLFSVWFVLLVRYPGRAALGSRMCFSQWPVVLGLLAVTQGIFPPQSFPRLLLPSWAW